jgi:hypothetical protein
MSRCFCRAQEDLISLSGDLVYVTPENIETAVQWIYSLKRNTSVDRLSACLAIDKAAKIAAVRLLVVRAKAPGIK